MLDYVNTINLNIHWIPPTTSKMMQKKLLVISGCSFVTEPFNITDNDFHAKRSARCARVLVVTELVVSGTQCTGRIVLSVQPGVFKWHLYIRIHTHSHTHTHTHTNTLYLL